MAAIDGQTFEQQPASVQASFIAVYGSAAAQMWEAEHSAAVRPPSSTPPPLPSPSPTGVPGAWNTATMALPGYMDALGSSVYAPGYIPGNADYNHWRLDRPGLFGTVAGTPGVNLQYGSGAAGDPTNGSEQHTPQEWMQGSRLFEWDGNFEGDLGYIANLFGRSPLDSPSGLAGNAISAPEPYWQGLYEQIRSGRVRPTARGWQFLQSVKGVSPEQIGGAAPAQAATAAASGAATGGAGAVAAMTPQMLDALAGRMTSAASGAYQQSLLTGVVMEPIFDKDGNWTFKPVLDANGQPISTQQAGLNKAQIEDMAARRAIDLISATGRFKDDNGQWVQTPAALVQRAQAGLIEAQTGDIAARLELDRQKQLAEALADPSRFVEGMALANLMGSSRGGPPAPSVGQAILNAPGAFPQSAPPPATGELNLIPPAARGAFPGTADGRLISGDGRIGVPTGELNPAAPAQKLGFQNPQDDRLVTYPFRPDQTAAPSVVEGAPTSKSLTDKLPGAQPGAFAAVNPALPLSPELNAALQHKTVPAFGNPEGTPGAFTTLNDLRGTDFTKLNPQQYANLSLAGQQQVASLAKATQNVRSQADLEKAINGQLVSGGRAPSAFRF